MGGADELSSYALAISCSWGFSFALFRKAHIRIDVLYVRLPRKCRHLMDLLALVLFGLYMIMLSYFAFTVVQTSLAKHSVHHHHPADFSWYLALSHGRRCRRGPDVIRGRDTG